MVWLSCRTQQGSDGALRSGGDADRSCKVIREEVGVFLRRGLVSGEDFFRELGEEIPRQAPRIRRIAAESRSADLDEILEDYDGPLVKILQVVPEGRSDDGKRRTYDLWVTFDKYEDGWGSFDHFRLIVVNPLATPETSAAAFARGAASADLHYESTEF